MSATNAILRNELRMFRRSPAGVFWIVVFPSVLLAILGAIPAFRDAKQGIDGVTVITFYVPIVVLMSMIMASFQSMPAVLTSYRERGILRRIGTTPARPQSLLLAQFAIHLGAVLVGSALAIAVGSFAYDVSLPRQAVGYAVAFVLAAAAGLALGCVIAATAPNTRLAAAFGTIVFFPMMFTAGVWLPVAAMPSTMRRIVEYTPMGASARALDAAAAGHWPQLTAVLVVLGWTVVAGAIAARFFKWE